MLASETAEYADRQNGRASFLERIAETLNGAAKTKTVYGDPVELDGVTVIPVAKVQYGFGGGGGEGKGKDGDVGEGAGGGGGVVAKPVGYIELKHGESKFRPIGSVGSKALLIAAGGLVGVLAISGISRLTHRAEKEGVDA